MNFFKAVAAASKKPAVSNVPAQTSYLYQWVNPALASVGDIVVSDLSAAAGYTSTSCDMTGINGASIVSLGGLNCWYCDGVNDRIHTSNKVNYPLTTNVVEFTIEGWVRSNGAWLSNGNWWNRGYNNGYRNRFTSAGNLWMYFSGTSRQTTATFATNTWHHIVVTCTPNPSNVNQFGTAMVYRNGTLLQTWTGINRDPNQTGNECIFGTFNSTSEHQRFYMGMIRQYTKALTATEVLYNYNLEKADYGY